MFERNSAGAFSFWPRQTYNPADIGPDGMWAVRQRLERDARRDGLGEEAAEEAASAMFLHWLTRNYARCDIPRGDHARAYFAVRRYARLSMWRGFTGQRRARKARVTAEQIAMRHRLRERNNPTPDAVAMAVERIAKAPAHGRKAYRLAKAMGMPGVRELVREACGFADAAPACHAAAPLPKAGVPATPGDGTEWRGLPFDLAAEMDRAMAK